jgi:hypothetical protein
MLGVTSLRNSHRELVALLLVTGSIIVAAGIADTAAGSTTTAPPSGSGTAGVGIQSVP